MHKYMGGAVHSIIITAMEIVSLQWKVRIAMEIVSNLQWKWLDLLGHRINVLNTLSKMYQYAKFKSFLLL